MQNASQQHEPDVPPLQVFIVEDSQPVRERLEEMLESTGVMKCVGVATTASAAITAILSTRPNAVILDLGLAEGSGFDVLRALHDRNTGIPVYIFSNVATESYRRLAAKLGAAAFFDKSTQFHAMRDVLAQHARQVQTTPHQPRQ